MLIGLVVLGLQIVAGIADKQSNSVNSSFEIVHLPIALIALGLFGVGANMAARATPRAMPNPRSGSSRAALVSVRRGSRQPDEG